MADRTTLTVRRRLEYVGRDQYGFYVFHVTDADTGSHIGHCYTTAARFWGES